MIAKPSTVSRTIGGKSVSFAWPAGHWDWPVPLNHAHGVRSGCYLFTGGQAALDANGAVQHPDDLQQQCALVMAYVKCVLEELGGSLSQLTRLVIYFVGDAADETAMLEQIAASLLDNQTADTASVTMPVVNTVCLPELCYPGMRLEVEGVAMCAENGAPLPRHETVIPSLPVLAGGFPHTVHCGDVVFFSNISALSAAGHVEFPDDIVAQTQLMMDRVNTTLQSVGGTASSVVKVNVFYVGDGTADNWAIPAKIRADYFAGSDTGPAATGITVPAMPVTGMMTHIAITAMVPQNSQPVPTRYAWPEGHWDWTTPLPYKHGNNAGGLIHLGGQVSLDSQANVIDADDIVAQTKRALDNIKKVLEELGAGLEHVVKVTTFYQGSASAEGLHQNLQIRSDTFGHPGPATSGIPVPHLVYPHMVIEIEVIAILNGCKM